jgi:hypothetical protein
MSSFLLHLRDRLHHSERCFLLNFYAESEESSMDILRDLSTLYSTGGRLLTKPFHNCTEGCPCQPTMILHLQCAFERLQEDRNNNSSNKNNNSNDDDIAIDKVKELYETPLNLPPMVFIVW